MDKKVPVAAKPKKPYIRPAASQLTPEQASLKLLGVMSEGGEKAKEAKEFLKLIFPDMAAEGPKKKKSA